MDSIKSFPPPAVPRDFDGNHKFDNLTSPKEASQEGKTLTAADRGAMLGEEPLPTPKKSVFDYMSKEDKERVMSSKLVTPKPVSTASATSTYSSATVSAPRKWSSNVHFGSNSFKPFTKDPAKQARYEEFLKARNTEQTCESSNDRFAFIDDTYLDANMQSLMITLKKISIEQEAVHEQCQQRWHNCATFQSLH